MMVPGERRFVRGDRRRDLVPRDRRWAVTDLRNAVELGFPVEETAVTAVANLPPGGIAEIILHCENQTLERRFAVMSLGFWLEESAEAFHYMVYRTSGDGPPSSSGHP